MATPNSSAITHAVSSFEPISGLTNTVARQRLSEYGYNKLPTEGSRSVCRIALSVVSEPMFLLLLACSDLYWRWLLGEPREAAMLGFAIVFMMAIKQLVPMRCAHRSFPVPMKSLPMHKLPCRLPCNTLSIMPFRKPSPFLLPLHSRNLFLCIV